MSRIEPLLAGLVSGPLGRGIAFLLDFVAALWRALGGDPRHPEERKVPPVAP